MSSLLDTCADQEVPAPSSSDRFLGDLVVLSESRRFLRKQFFPSIDVDFGLTASTDHLIVKCILGLRFD